MWIQPQIAFPIQVLLQKPLSILLHVSCIAKPIVHSLIQKRWCFLLSAVLIPSCWSLGHYSFILKCSSLMLHRLIDDHIGIFEIRSKRHQIWIVGFEALLFVENLFSQLLESIWPIVASHAYCVKHGRSSWMRRHHALHRRELIILQAAFIYRILIRRDPTISKIRWRASFIWCFHVDCQVDWASFSCRLLLAVEFKISSDIIWFSGFSTAQDFSLGSTGRTADFLSFGCEAVRLFLYIKRILFALMLGV